MRHLRAATALFSTILDDERLPAEGRGKALSALGTVCLTQRDWAQALESYQKALEWKEKTGQHHELGSTWHQIGSVHEEQGDFSTALSYYLQAVEVFVQTGAEENSAIASGSRRRIFPGLSPEEKETLKKTVPNEVYEMLEEESAPSRET